MTRSICTQGVLNTANDFFSPPSLVINLWSGSQPTQSSKYQTHCILKEAGRCFVPSKAHNEVMSQHKSSAALRDGRVPAHPGHTLQCLAWFHC